MRVLTLDIETSPHEGYFWSFFKPFISPDRVLAPTRMLTWSAKWLGTAKIEARTEYDEDFHERLAQLLDEADVVVTYNGEGFDMPHIRRELIERGYPPVRPTASVDLYRAVKKLFKFPSYRLDYVARVLLDEQKLSTGGFELWRAFLAGDEKAIRKMVRYNKQDVKVTENLYLFVRPWIKNHPYAGSVEDVDMKDDNETYECGVCTSPNMAKQRPRRTRCFAIRQLRCVDCGHWQDGKRRKIA